MSEKNDFEKAEIFEKSLNTETMEQTASILGSYDGNIRQIEREFGVSVSTRQSVSTAGDCIAVRGGDEQAVNDAYSALSYLSRMAALGTELTEQSVLYVISMVRSGSGSEISDLGDDCICVTTRGKPIKAKTVGQKKYIEAIRNNTVVLGVGPAGTGKTFLAVAEASRALRKKEISRIILTRPAVEAGEKLGYLPGDLQTKINPYLRPLHDALFEMFGSDTYARHIERGTIEIAPLAYMRGRTLDEAFIILDEAQNTTPEQMKMFLTRLGYGSKAVVTGDITQTDLPFGKKSGLAEAMKVLTGVEDIAIHNFTERDVVRHRLVQRIILAYDRYEKEQKQRQTFRISKDKQ